MKTKYMKPLCDFRDESLNDVFFVLGSYMNNLSHTRLIFYYCD